MENTSKKKFWGFLAVLVALLLLGYYLWQNGSVRLPGLSNKASYQALFLSNGQVYFGKSSDIGSQFVTLRDVYYLQVNQILQPTQNKKKEQPTAQQAISLVKLGTTELHKPKDEMRINRDHIVFIEDLQDDSQVVQAIQKYKTSQK